MIWLSLFVAINIVVTLALILVTNSLDGYFEGDFVAYAMIAIDLATKFVLIFFFATGFYNFCDII